MKETYFVLAPFKHKHNLLVIIHSVPQTENHTRIKNELTLPNFVRVSHDAQPISSTVSLPGTC